MRALVLGGTNFIGRAVVEALVAAGHEPLVCHRGEHEPTEGAVSEVPHLHVDRAELAASRHEIEAFGPGAVVDCLAMSQASILGVTAALPDPALRWVVLSSMDVYRAFGGIQHGTVTDAVPISEASPTREDSHPYPDAMPDYSKLEVEEVVIDRGGVVLRLPMVYGPHDYQRREEPLLRRVRAGRTQIPVGAMNATLPMGFVHDVARGIVAAVDAEGAAGEIFHVCEEQVRPAALWARQVLKAAGSEAELVPVEESLLPDDLGLLGTIAQPFVADTSKARRILGYVDTPWEDAIGASVAWHLEHPPVRPEGEPDPGFSSDDAALTSVAANAHVAR
jgi:nucleoside-diphosphate-sugar epimerase